MLSLTLHPQNHSRRVMWSLSLMIFLVIGDLLRVQGAASSSHNRANTNQGRGVFDRSVKSISTDITGFASSSIESPVTTPKQHQARFTVIYEQEELEALEYVQNAYLQREHGSESSYQGESIIPAAMFGVREKHPWGLGRIIYV